MPWLKRIWLLPKAAKQLGKQAIWHFAIYQVKLRSGWLRLQTPSGRRQSYTSQPSILIRPAAREQIERLLGDHKSQILEEANAIVVGEVTLFGAKKFKLTFKPTAKLKHWSHYHSQMPDGSDIKPVWELGRFGWAAALARAYWLSGNEHYAEVFWQRFEEFVAANPPNLGPHWSSGQEVALRIISLAFCYSLIAKAIASSSKRKVALAQSISEHAMRIPLTLDYARAQNNNHLLSEAAGLFTAGSMLPDHPKSVEWRQLGLAIFNEGIAAQVHEDGAYAQHSANYHRLMLQLGAWMHVVTAGGLPLETIGKLHRATTWLQTLLDEETGKAPNLGPNDGAYFLPLTVLPFADYRPAVQTAGTAFGAPGLKTGPWDELQLWLGLSSKEKGIADQKPASPVRLAGKDSWAYFRAAQFKERPGHADQLLVDLWWRGINLACDAGSNLYTAPPPWNNALAGTKVHNALTINGHDQMTRASRFLWLDWAQAKLLASRPDKKGNIVFASAEHNGYARLGLTHRRDVTSEANRWIVTDHVLPNTEKRRAITTRLHWLLPDWEWQLENSELRLKSPHGRVELAVEASVGEETKFSIIRAGERIEGEAESDPVLGWYSSTYGEKEPALSLLVDVSGKPPFTIITTWTLPA